jgi:hypothetical protein
MALVRRVFVPGIVQCSCTRQGGTTRGGNLEWSLTTTDLLTRCGIAAHKSNIATRRIKPEIESLKAYTAPPRPPKTQPDYTRLVPALCIGITAVAPTGFGIVANASFIADRGGPGFAAAVLSGLGVTIEILALGLPPLAAILAAHGKRHSVAVAWCICVPCVAMVLVNSCGFSSRYIGDGAAAREQVTDHTSAQKAELANLTRRNEGSSMNCAVSPN